MKGRKKKKKHIHLLPESARGEQLSDKIDVPLRGVNPIGIKLHNVLVLQSLEKMDFTIKSVQVLRALQEIMELHLVPGNLNPFILIKSPITGIKLHQKKKTKQTQDEQNSMDQKESELGWCNR